ncbi:hypothetical protein D9M71_333880 [compost metagenome]
MVVHFAVDLGAVQGIEQLVVARRHLDAGQDAPAHIFRPLRQSGFAKQENRQVFVPGRQLLERFQRPALALHGAKQHAEYVAVAAGEGRNGFAPLPTAAGKVVFTEEVEDYREFAATLGVVIDQENSGFAPHLDLSSWSKRPAEGGKKNTGDFTSPKFASI